MLEFKTLEECKKYYNKDTNTYKFVKNKEYLDIKICFDFKADASIIARNIDAWNINAQDIHARDIIAQDIHARDIDAWNIIAQDIDAWNINALDIDAQDIHARDIIAQDIHAQDIDAWNINALDIDAENIIARNIDAWNIDALDIDAWNINALDIDAWNIIAQDIDAWNINALDIDAQDIDARNVKVQKEGKEAMTKKYIETSNVAEVVRCWECEYYYFLAETKKKAGRCKKFGTDGSGPDLSPYDFCSFGKPLPNRRRGEDNGTDTGTMA